MNEALPGLPGGEPWRRGWRPRWAKCHDCLAVDMPHASGCVTAAVERGDITPRQRQIMRLEREESQRPPRATRQPTSADPLADFHRLLKTHAVNGRAPTFITMGRRAYTKLCSAAADLNPTDSPALRCMGVRVAVSDLLGPDEILVGTDPTREEAWQWGRVRASDV